jgi:hypothetical protein
MRDINWPSETHLKTLEAAACRRLEEVEYWLFAEPTIFSPYIDSSPDLLSFLGKSVR